MIRRKEDGMLVLRQLRWFVLLALVLVLCGPATAQQDDKGNSEGGYGSAAKIARFIQARGIWGKDGFTIMAVKPGGPATRMRSADGKTVASLEPGDQIVEVAGTKIESQVDYARAMNGAKDPQRIEIEVRDRSSGKVYTWYVGSKDSPFAD
jgi:S1-C subfamily serine protease